jgi:hypothetical protein
MNYKDALEFLEIKTELNLLNLDNLKKQYRKMALKYHPDKNGNTIESNDHFKKINEAYNFLKNEIKDLYPPDDSIEDDLFNENSIYFNVLKNFIKSVMPYGIDIIAKIVNDILLAGRQISLKIFEDLDKDTALSIYQFLSKYRGILHFSNELLDNVRQIVVDKYNNVNFYILNPNINDLLENNFYKLYIDNKFYLVPLWHNECYYDGSGCEIVVICDPELPENIQLDDDNNLYIIKVVSAHNEIPNKILENDVLEIKLGNKILLIPISELYMKSEQYYTFKKQGITKIKNDLYDVGDKSDIIVKILIV